MISFFLKFWDFHFGKSTAELYDERWARARRARRDAALAIDPVALFLHGVD